MAEPKYLEEHVNFVHPEWYVALDTHYGNLHIECSLTKVQGHGRRLLVIT